MFPNLLEFGSTIKFNKSSQTLRKNPTINLKFDILEDNSMDARGALYSLEQRLGTSGLVG